MSKLKVQMKSKFQMTEGPFDISSLVINLIFACLPVGRGFDIWI
jgi:hypothetical protein